MPSTMALGTPPSLQRGTQKNPPTPLPRLNHPELSAASPPRALRRPSRSSVAGGVARHAARSCNGAALCRACLDRKRHHHYSARQKLLSSTTAESARHDRTTFRPAARSRIPLICALVLGRAREDVRRGGRIRMHLEKVVAGLGGGQGLRCPIFLVFGWVYVVQLEVGRRGGVDGWILRRVWD